jgi:very-short-patch-repair endonuclease
MSGRIVVGDLPLVSPTEYARQLRRDETDAERHLWQRLRNRALGVKFRRQHPVAGYILDFCCLSHRLVVELDGDQHVDPEAVLRDAQRDQALRRMGLRVVRFGNRQVLTEPQVVLDVIRALLDEPELDEKCAAEGSTKANE